MFFHKSRLRIATHGQPLVATLGIAISGLALQAQQEGHELQLQHDVVVPLRMLIGDGQSKRLVETAHVGHGI